MTATTIVVGILVLGAALAALLVLRSARGRRRALQDVPPSMRPAYSDEELEQTVAYRYRAWGLVLFVFFALFLPMYWFFEAGRLNEATEGFFVQSVVRGEALYVENCSECHGPEGGGGAALSPYGQDSWPAPDLTNIAARYEENNNITDIRDFIVTTIERGRPGTPMPTWGAAFGGPLTDQQISEITDWILSQQTGEAEEVAAVEVSGEQLYQENCVKCHGENLNGLFVPDAPDEEATEDARPPEPALRPGPSLVGVFERHDRETILGILRNGIYLPAGVSMPPWQTGYMYPEKRFDDESLNAIVDYLENAQPDELPEGTDQYQTPGTGTPGATLEDDTTTALRDAARG